MIEENQIAFKAKFSITLPRKWTRPIPPCLSIYYDRGNYRNLLVKNPTWWEFNHVIGGSVFTTKFRGCCLKMTLLDHWMVSWESKISLELYCFHNDMRHKSLGLIENPTFVQNAWECDRLNRASVFVFSKRGRECDPQPHSDL